MPVVLEELLEELMSGINGINIPIYNYTPHSLDIDTGDAVVSIPSTGLARVEQVYRPHRARVAVHEDHFIPLVTSSYGQVTGLEDFDWDTPSILVVSVVVARHLIEDEDRFRGAALIGIPAQLVRYKDGPMKGQVKGCQALEIMG